MVDVAMLLSLMFGAAVARDVTITVVDAEGRPVSAARLTTACGCRALVDAETGVWRGDAIPGATGSVELVRGAMLELDVSAKGYQTTRILYRVRRRSSFVVELRELPLLDLVGELDYRECGRWRDAYETEDGGNEEAAPSAFTPPPPPSPPPSPPPAGWDCRKPH